MLSDILSGICSDILSSILSGIYFYILSDIYFDILSKILSGILSAIYVLTLYLAFVLAFYLTYIWPIYNNSHLAISSLIRFGEFLGLYLCLTDHVGALLFLAKEYVKKQLFISWKVDSPLDLIEALHLRPNSQKNFSASEKCFLLIVLSTQKTSPHGCVN
jgi:hypothetical protein